MDKQRRHFSAQQKVQIIREHLLEKKPISEVCQKHGINPTLFYRWQQEFFENGAAAFEQPPRSGRVSLEQKRIATLEAKLQQKNEVMAELMADHIL